MKKPALLLLLCLQIASAKAQLITVFKDNTHQLTGVAVSKTNRLFTNYPKWGAPYQYAVVEIKNGKAVPFPDTEWNKQEGDKEKHWRCVQAVVTDDQDNLWVVDAGSRQPVPEANKGQKLVKINLATNQVEKIYPLSEVTDGASYMNDVRIDTRQQLAYITNSSEGGIVIVALKTGKVRQVLKNNPVTTADTNYILQRNGQPLKVNGQPFRINADGLALSHDGTTLYFKSLTDTRLYKVQTADLNDTTLSDDALATKVQHLGNFTTTDGMTIDAHNNLYLGDLEHRKIIRISPALKTSVIISDESLAWPDSYQITSDGWLYISCSRIDEQPQFHNGKSERKGPYTIFKYKLF